MTDQQQSVMEAAKAVTIVPSDMLKFEEYTDKQIFDNNEKAYICSVRWKGKLNCVIMPERLKARFLAGKSWMSDTGEESLRINYNYGKDKSAMEH